MNVFARVRRPQGGQATIVMIAVLGFGCDAMSATEGEAIFVGTAPFEEVRELRLSEEPTTLPEPEVLLEFPQGSPYWRINNLAVRGDGLIALGHSPSCTVVFFDARESDYQARLDVCGDRGRGITDLYWLNSDELGVFDAWSGEIRTFGTDGAQITRVPVPASVTGGFVTAAFPLEAIRGLVTAFEPVDEAARLERRLVELVLPGRVEARPGFLELPDIGLREDLRFPFGLEVCVEQGVGASGGTRVLAGNRWAHEAIMFSATDSSIAYRTSYLHEVPHLVREGRGLLTPQLGGFGVACGEDFGVAHRTIRTELSNGSYEVYGLLDWISFDGRLLGRFDLSTVGSLTFANELGVARDGRLFALSRDSLTLRLLVIPLEGEKEWRGSR